MFQMLVVDLIIGDVAATLREVETTNCKLPERLERLQAEWRQRQQATKDWAAYHRHIGASQPPFASVDEWIADCQARAATKGPKYGGGKGEGKGGAGKGGQGANRRSDGKGKGWGKGG